MVQPVVLEGLSRRGGTVGVEPELAGLRLHFDPRELQLVGRHAHKDEVLFSRHLGRRGSVLAALAGLQAAGACECYVQKVLLQEEGNCKEVLHVLLGVNLLEPFFEVEPETEDAAQVAALVLHWGQLATIAGSDTGVSDESPFAAELRHGWRQEQQQQGPGDGAVAGECWNGAAGGNPRDIIFDLVLPSDWQLEAAEPPGLACTLFRYQRRCLAWLKWRESLLSDSSSLGGKEAGGRPALMAAEATAAAGSAAAADGAAPDPGSSKSVLPWTNLLWQPVVLPSGQRVFYNAVNGCLRRQGVTPPLPEVPGGLLCDEMGLGKTVEMLALFLANPPPPGWQQYRPTAQQAATSTQGQPAGSGGESDVVEEVAAAAAAGGGARASAASLSTPAKGTAGGISSHPLRGGTLVVCPPALLQQWQSEVSNHAHGALVVEIYDGLRGLQGAMQQDSSSVKRQKPAQREMDMYARLLARETVEALFDVQAEAASALRRLQAADVVLTSFDVLRAEVYFVPNGRSFRHKKRYKVPHCPLLQVFAMHWWRLVVDEAQMVGPLSAAGTMCERMVVCHRWCVTGTPMGAHRSDELSDIRALLQTLQHQPFADAVAWRRLVVELLAKGGSAAAEAWQLLSHVLKPLMWRNTKGVVAQEFHLPARTLHPLWLSFQAGERAFYEQVVDKTRKAREELLSFWQQQADPDDDDEPSSPATSRTRKRRQAKQSERLELAAADNLTQLRLACIHPQLTKYWRNMAAEGQLSVGTTLSMEEIMQRLVDSAQNDLQEAERSLCAHLNTLAMRLIAKAQEAIGGSGGGGRQAQRQGTDDGDMVAAVQDGGGPASPRPAKRPRKNRGVLETMSRNELHSRALLLLEQSFRVAEKGIAAIDVDMEQLHGMPDIAAASTNTVNAWKRLQINTASQLGKLHAAAGREEEERKMDKDVQEKVAYLRSQAEMELQSAQQRLEQAQQQADTARQVFRLHLGAAAEHGFVQWGITSSASVWLAELEGMYRDAQEDEERELEVQEGLVKHMLGTRVATTLDEQEKQLHAELSVLDRYVSEQHSAAAHRRLLREQHRWDLVAGSSAGSGEAALLDSGVALLWDLLHTLPDFRRKTLLAQHVVVFSQQMAGEAQCKREDATRRKQEQAAAKAAAAAAAEAEAVVAGDLEIVGVNGQQERAVQLQQQQQALTPQQHDQQLLAEAQQQAQEDGEALAAILETAEGRRAFIESSSWQGRVDGYVFKLGDSGLGYYLDFPPKVEAFLTLARLQTVAAAVGRALQDHQRRLARSAGPEAALFASLGLDAVEAKLESVQQQIHLVRALKEQHIAERTAVLKAALQEDLDAELADAALLPPVLGGGSADKLQKEIEGLRGQATSLLHRMRYMESRVSEARSLHATRRWPQQGAQTAQAAQQQQQPEHTAQQQQQADAVPEMALPSEQLLPAPAQQQDAAAEHGAGPSGAASAGAEAVGNAAEDAGEAGAGAGPNGGLVDHSAGMECPVCLSTVPAGTDIHVFSGCGHAFCPDCTAKLVLQQGFCAVCRQKVSKKQVFRVAAGGASTTGSTCDPEFEALGKIQPQGEWSIKVEALLRRLVHLLTTAPAEKCLVFSQFPDALKMVAMALQTNGIRFVQLLGGRQAARKAVASFRDDDEVKVFLLSHKAGAQGLTLVRANHVFLLEPALEPAIEQQAVARVHRIGQQRPVVVTRLLVRDSIEHRVLAVQEAKHALFSGADGAAEDTAELATTVEAPVKSETLGRQDMEGLLDGM